MIAMKEKRSLFGGALRCAGLVSAAAMTTGAAADFSPLAGPASPNYTFNYGVGPGPDYVYHVFTYDLAYGAAFPADTITVNQDGSLIAYSNAAAMGASAYVAPGSQWQYAGAVVVQYFTVEANKGATVNWDLTAGNGAANVLVYQFGVGYLVNEVAGSAGSTFLNLTAGETYAFIARASLTGGFGQSASASFIWVPAPGAIGLLGAGLVTTRRRRRRE